MAEQLREHVCPNCGAPLGIPHSHERYFKCQFCGTVLEDNASKEEQETGVFKIKISQDDIDAARMARIPVYTSPPVITTYSSSYGGTTMTTGAANSGRLGCIITTVILLFVGGILVISLFPTILATGALAKFFSDVGLSDLPESVGLDPIIEGSGLGGLRIYSFGAVAMLPSDNDTTPDFIGVGSASDDKDYVMYVDFENSPALRWRTEVSGEDVTYGYDVFIADQTRVYFSYADNVVAFNRQQGTVLWQITLVDEIQHNICPGCFQEIGDAIVTLSTDGTLAAYDSATGTKKWSVRLNSTPRQVINFGGNPAVLDQLEGIETTFNTYNVSDGSLVQQFSAACENEPFPDSPQYVGIYDTMLQVPNGAGVIFFAGIFDPGCAQLWKPGQSQPTWVANFDSNLARAADEEHVLLTADTLYLTSSDGAYAINMADGSFRTVTENEDYSFEPIAARDGVLVLAANRTRGTSRYEVWGVDDQLGNVKWTFVTEASEPFDYASHPLYGEGYWTAGLTADGLTIAQLFGEPGRAVFQTIPLQNGTASSPVTYNFKQGIGSFWTSVLGWRNNEFWVLVDSSVYVLDATTATGSHVWP